MKHLALLLLVVGCGKSDKAAPSSGGSGSSVSAATAPSGSWVIGGLTVPESAIPQKLGDVPTVLPKRIGDEVLGGEISERAMVIPDKLNVSYLIGTHPNDDLVRGYQAMIYVDPLADLEAKWGPSVGKTGTEYDTARCWTSTRRQLETCVFKNTGQDHWYVTTVTTARPADRPMTTVAAEPAGTYDDFPVGVGPCNVAGIKEISEIVGTQLQYLQPEPDNLSCNLVPAIDKAASRMARQVTASEAIASVPDVNILRQAAKHAQWSAFPIEALGEKATWDGLGVLVQVDAFAYKVRVTDPTKKVRWLKDRALQIARKVATRAQALPAE